MAAQNNRQFGINTKLALVSSILDKSSVTHTVSISSARANIYTPALSAPNQ